ncbi:MAG: acyl-CoA thioesterase [Bacillota bacterium]
MPDGKTPEETSIVMTELVLPGMTNLLGNLLGGQMMHWMDIAGALCCMRHCNLQVATIAVEALEFRHPVRQGEMVSLMAKLIWTGRTSMKVKITASAENLATGATIITNVAKLTFVALDTEGRKAEVPCLLPQTCEEKTDYDCEDTAYRSRVSGC